MRDFTLVIPTWNGAERLEALLSYLEAQEADCHILVLESSCAEVLATNRARVGESRLDVEFATFPDLECGEKRRRGIHKVTTPFCALCADRDLVILDGVRQCLDLLRRNPAASVAQGCCFWFQPRSDGQIELNNIAYPRAAIEDLSPLGRLVNLFQEWQILKSGVFRTPVLLRICGALQPITSALARDLLWSALTVIEGQLIHVSDFSYASRNAPFETYARSHPLEWLCNDPDGLFAEYLRYRELLVAAVMRRPENELQSDEVRDLLDLIHLRYLLRYAPDAILQFVAEQQMAGVAFEQYWPRCQLHSLVPANIASATSPKVSKGPALSIRGRERSYLLSSDFYAPGNVDSPPLNSVVRLLAALDDYRPSMAIEPNASPAS
jgi:glycosyltransferase domain-containing protein